MPIALNQGPNTDSLFHLGNEMARELGGSPWDYEQHSKIALCAFEGEESDHEKVRELGQEVEELEGTLHDAKETLANLVTAVDANDQKALRTAMTEAEAALE